MRALLRRVAPAVAVVIYMLLQISYGSLRRAIHGAVQAVYGVDAHVVCVRVKKQPTKALSMTKHLARPYELAF